MTTDETENSSGQNFPSDLKERYLDARLVGAGGMGRVFSAEDRRLAKSVAIKLLPPNNDNPKAIIRFQQEAKAVSKLNNKHIVQVMDFGFTEDREPFLVMELIDGEDLAKLVDRTGPLPISKVVEIAIQICSGLEHAHANGVVHRDLKPSNIMLDNEACVRILDFGLAKIITQTVEDFKLTRPGQPVGSILYMSPEQFDGTQADERTDVYAVGLVIYHMMAGHVPHENENLMALIRHRREDEPPAIPHRADAAAMCEALNKIVKSALAIDPDVRFSSMTGFKEALNHCLAIGIELPKLHTASVEKSPSRKVPGAPILVFCALVMGAVLFFVFPRGQTPIAPNEEVGTTLSTGLQLPPGFLFHQDSDIDWWLADENLPDAGMDRLKNSGVSALSLMTNKAITDDAIFRIRDIKSIVALSLRDTKTSDDCIDDLNKMHLKALDIRSTKITEKGVMRLIPSDALQNLDVKYLKLSNVAMNHIVDSFPNLISLNIGSTLINGEGLKRVKDLKALKQIYLVQLNLNDKDVDPLFSHDLSAIELAANPITHVTIEKILKLKSVNKLLLVSCLKVTRADINRLEKQFPDAEITSTMTLPEGDGADMLDLFESQKE